MTWPAAVEASDAIESSRGRLLSQRRTAARAEGGPPTAASMPRLTAEEDGVQRVAALEEGTPPKTTEEQGVMQPMPVRLPTGRRGARRVRAHSAALAG
jgi:hypothetical protein